MNNLLTIGMITQKGLFVLKNTCSFLPLISSEYSKEYAVTGAKIGYSLNIRKPPRYEIRVGQAAQLQQTKESFATLALTSLIGVDLPFSMADRTLSLDRYTERITVPKMAAIANRIDYDVAQLGQKVANSVGSIGVTPTTLLTYNQAAALLSDLGTPKGNGRSIVMTPDMHATLVGQNPLLVNPSSAVGEQYRTGQIAKYGGFEFFEDQNCPTHTVGALGGTPLVNTAGQSGASLITDGWTSAAATRLNVGDTFTIANVYSVNPQSRQSTKKLRQFVVTAPGVSDSSGNMTISISPAIVTTGPFQNVDSAPADNAALTIVGTANLQARYGLAFHKGFAAVGFADLELPPKGVVESFRAVDEDTGISMATVTAYDVMGGQTITRTDVLYGTTILYEDLACRIWQL